MFTTLSLIGPAEWICLLLLTKANRNNNENSIWECILAPTKMKRRATIEPGAEM